MSMNSYEHVDWYIFSLWSRFRRSFFVKAFHEPRCWTLDVTGVSSFASAGRSSKVAPGSKTGKRYRHHVNCFLCVSPVEFKGLVEVITLLVENMLTITEQAVNTHSKHGSTTSFLRHGHWPTEVQ